MLRTQRNILAAGIEAMQRGNKPTPESINVGSPKVVPQTVTSPAAIPPPPKPTLEQQQRDARGVMTLVGVPNPAFLAWKDAYGQAWDEKVRQERAAANSAAIASSRNTMSALGGLPVR